MLPERCRDGGGSGVNVSGCICLICGFCVVVHLLINIIGIRIT